MSLISAAIDGNLERTMKAEIRDVAAGLRRAATSAATETQADLRRQARKTGFRDGGRSLANAWRLRVFPAPGMATLHPAALIWSRMPDVAEVFDGDHSAIWPLVLPFHPASPDGTLDRLRQRRAADSDILHISAI